MSVSVLVGAAAVAGSAAVLWRTVFDGGSVRRRVAQNLVGGLPVVGAGAATEEPAGPASVTLSERLADLARRTAPAAITGGVNRRILRAGMSSKWTVERTLVVKGVLGVVGLFLGFAMITSGNPIGVVYGMAAPFVFFYGADLMLGLKATGREKQIRLALPDTLDQITVCVEAGLGFEAAMARCAKTGQGPLADELLRTLQDVQLGVPRKEAMRRLADRSDVEELRHFVLAIIQAEGYGVPIARVLRIQSSELREKRRQEAEERAVKVGIKMLFPLVLCILPTVFIVILSPAIFRLMDSLHGNNF
jgi:tight adherence protein C